MMTSSRVRYFENRLKKLKDYQSLKALFVVKSEMCTEQGFSRQDKTHYYFHCVDVAQIIINFNITDPDVITAALLHDIVEDVEEYTIEKIEEMFNPRVASLVYLVTKQPDIDYKVSKNLQYYLDRIEENVWAAIIKTADRMHNFGTLRYCSLEKKIRQAIETKMFFFPFFKRCRKMYPEFAPFFHFAKTFIEPHLWEIEAHHETILAYEKTIKSLRNNP